jgi:DNA invertase Pin-like site-specific DNA recombinase
MSKTPIRCAVYTRKSSEEGLEQSFNSLDAQREACEAFIASQKHEGWILIKTHYDDGGFSGGSMERPALKQLLADVSAGKVNTVVVYKIDRLTRSLLDFSKIVEAFDAQKVSFVSITQQFNTTTSMGRLTLNILLSFAQFEREVTGERIRDKFAASKKKGMWMGGNVPFGYRVENRQLVIEPTEAAALREIYRQYLKLGNVTDVRSYLESGKLRSRTNKLFSRGALYHLLGSRIYIGEIAHRGQIYPGQHEAIIDRKTWDAVAEQLRSNAPRLNRPRATTPSLLTGLVFDTEGVRYTPTHTARRGRRYRYYTSQSMIQHQEPAGIARIPAAELENLVQSRLRRLLTTPDEFVRLLGVRSSQRLTSAAQTRCKQWSKLDASQVMALVKLALQRVVVGHESIELRISGGRLRALIIGAEQPAEVEVPGRTISVICPIQVRSIGAEIRIISEEVEPTSRFHSAAFLKGIARSRDWYEQIVRGEAASFEDLAKQHMVTSRYIRRVFRCASLSPQTIQAVLADRPVNVGFEGLRRRIPLDWSKQMQKVS